MSRRAVGDEPEVHAVSVVPSDALWNAMAELSQLLLHEESVNTTLQRVATLAVTLMERIDHSGITVRTDNRPITDAATGGVVFEVDNYQYDVDQGPCLHALLHGEVVEIPCMGAEQRWSEYARFAADRGIHSSLSFPMQVDDDTTVGVMNLYSACEGEFSDEEKLIGTTFARQAAVAIHNARTYQLAAELTQQLQEALSSRAVIEQAKGALMVIEGCGPDEAFALLKRRSQHANRKLRDIAAEVVDGAADGRRR